jgi:hypothetical protein
MWRHLAAPSWKFPDMCRHVAGAFGEFAQRVAPVGGTSRAVSRIVAPRGGTSRAVSRTVARVGGTKNPKRDAIAQLEPDLVLCNAEENREERQEGLHGVGRTRGTPRVSRGGAWAGTAESRSGAGVRLGGDLSLGVGEAQVSDAGPRRPARVHSLPSADRRTSGRRISWKGNGHGVDRGCGRGNWPLVMSSEKKWQHSFSLNN